MITYLKGKVVEKNEKSLVMEVNNIGYKVFVSNDTISSTKENHEFILWTHLAIREDSHTLFGFKTKEELNFFELLISSVSGIGPKTALGILNVSSIESLKRAIFTGDTSHLTKISGIGKKMADKIVLELKGKIGAESEESVSLKDEVESLEALKALGYSHKEARDALKEIGNDAKDTGERIKKALKILGK